MERTKESDIEIAFGYTNACNIHGQEYMLWMIYKIYHGFRVHHKDCMILEKVLHWSFTCLSLIYLQMLNKCDGFCFAYEKYHSVNYKTNKQSKNPKFGGQDKKRSWWCGSNWLVKDNVYIYIIIHKKQVVSCVM